MAALSAAIIATLIVTAPAGAETPSPAATAAREYVPGEVLVRYRSGTSSAERSAARARVEAASASGLPVARLELVQLDAGDSVRAAVRRLEHDESVLYAEPNFLRGFHAIPDDPLFGRLWGLHNTGAGHGRPDADIDAPEAWDLTTGDSDVVVALLDSGVNYNHPDLAPNIWANPGETGAGRETNGVDDDGNGFVDDVRGWDFGGDDETRGPDNDPMDLLGHGTHTAGTIAAAGDNGIGVVGVGQDTTLMPIKLGTFDVSLATSIAGIRYADEMGADVVNMSYGGWPASQAEEDAIKAAEDVLFAISAGNDGSSNDERPIYPCGYRAQNVVCVAASERRDRLAFFSNFGSHSVDIAAPGHHVLSTAWRPVARPRFRDDFDGRLHERWRTSGPGDQWGIETRRRRIPIPPEILPEPIIIKSGVLSDSPDGRYRNNANTSVRTPAVNLVADSGCAASYRIAGSLERGYDRLFVEGWNGSSWEELARHTGQIDRSKSSLPLDDFANDPAFRLRFRLETDGSGRADGVTIGDFAIDCRSRYWSLSGTSMAAPHVAGAALLLAAAFPSADPLELKARLLAGADRLPAFRDRVMSDGRLNVARSLIHEDTRPPRTTTSDPKVLGRGAKIRLRSSEALSHFRCRVDTGAWKRCRPVHKTAPLAPGPHVIRAVAIDYFGNEDPTPAVARFRIGR